MYLLIVLIPLLSFLTSSLFGRFIGRTGSTLITTSLIFITAILSTIAFYEVAIAETNCYIRLFPWFDSALLQANWGFLFDSLTVLMLIVVTYVSAVVHLYSVEYMGNDPHIQRFMSYLSLFTFFMLILVTADNFIQMFIGWEGVGLASFLLINFWTTRLQANKAAMKALIVNRIGDFGLSLGIFTIFFVFGAVDYSTVFAIASDFSNNDLILFGFHFNVLTIICFFLFMGAVGKSSQLGLHTWLPDAMEGPTPVSALIHAATMVTAGVFLIVRCSPIFEYCPNILILITFLGAVTSFFAATSGAFQNDLKRVIAYSTCSQLGYMVFACGISSYSVTMFHLMNHAFFKALLFLSAGSIIHALHDEQDMRKMGALNRLLPFTYIMTVIGSFALIGFPFLTGYYSKDFILEVACAKMNFSGNIAYWLGVPTAAFTTFYSYRLLFMTFLNKTNSFKQSIAHAHEPKLCMSLPLILLSFGSLFIGYLTKDMIIGFGSSFWGNSVFILSENLSYLEAEYLPYHIKMIPFVFSHLGLVFAYHTTSFFFNSVSFSSATTTNTSLNSFFLDTYFTNSFQKTIYLRELTLRFIPLSIYTFFSRTWGFDDFYNRLIVQKFMTFGYNISFRVFDLGWIAYLGPYGISKTVLFLSRKFSSLSTGFVYHYAFILLIGLLLFIFFAIPHFSTFFTFAGFESITVTLYFIFILTFFFLLSKTIKL